MRGLMIWCLTVGLAHAREGCPELVSTATLSRHISEADMACSTMDESTFRTARWTAQRAIPCLGEPIQAGQAAAYYRMEALGSFVDQHHAQTVGFFKSMLRVAPHYLLPEAMAPDGHPLRVNFEVAQGSMPLEGAPVQRAGDGVIRIDGRTGTEFPKDRPYLFQHVSDSGIVLTSTVVGIGIEPPRYGTMRGLQNANAGRGQAVTQKVQRSPSPIQVNVPLAYVAGGAAAVAGITYALAVSTESKFWDPTTQKADLKGLKKQTNTMVWVSGISGTVALGTGVSAFLVGEF
jgi:hypothetical protein